MEKCKQKRKQQCCVKELDLFVTLKLLDDTPAVLSLANLCEGHGYSYGWTSGQSPNLMRKGTRTMQYGKLRADRCPRIINQFIQLDYKYMNNIVTEGRRRPYIASSINTKSLYKQSRIGRPVPRIHKHQKTQIKMRTSTEHRETCCATCLIGWTNSQRIVDERVPSSRDTPASSSRE